MQVFKTVPIHSKGVEWQQNITNQNFEHQTTLNPEHSPQQGFWKVSWEITPALAAAIKEQLTGTSSAQELHHWSDALLPGLTHLKKWGEETLVSFVLFMTHERSWLAQRTWEMNAEWEEQV